MGKYLLLIVASASVTAGALHLAPGLDVRVGGQARSADHLAVAVAEQLSATGLSEATAALAGLTTMPSAFVVEGTLMGGTYSATVTPTSSDTVTVRSVGRLPRSGGGGAEHVREVRFELAVVPATEPPTAAFLRNALTIEGDLTMNDAQRVRAEDPSENASIHTNGGDAVNIGENAGIQGFYYSVRPVPHDWLKPRLRSSFVPNQNPDGLEVFQTADRIEIPVIRATDYLPVATQVSRASVQNAWGVLNFVQDGRGTAENPAVWVIRGDFSTAIGQSLQINGHVNIITQGNVNLQGTTTTGPNSAVSFYSQQGISVNGTTQMVGSLMANQNVQIGGAGTKIYGPVSTRGTLNFNSDAHILYRPLSGYMTRVVFSPGPAPSEARQFRAVSYRAS